MAQETIDVLEEFDSLESIQAVLLDNTASNTGFKNGLIVCLENKLGKSLQTIGCSLHQNELPWKALFKKLDGGTSGPNSFTGPIGQKCQQDIQDQAQVDFDPIPTTLEIMPDNILKDLSHDQRLLYEYCLGISIGKVKQVWADRKISPVNHARWLTLAVRIMQIYTRTTNPTSSLCKLAHYCVKVYAPAWFLLKQSSQLKDTPAILFKSMQDIKGLLSGCDQNCQEKHFRKCILSAP